MHLFSLYIILSKKSSRKLINNIEIITFFIDIQSIKGYIRLLCHITNCDFICQSAYCRGRLRGKNISQS